MRGTVQTVGGQAGNAGYSADTPGQAVNVGYSAETLGWSVNVGYTADTPGQAVEWGLEQEWHLPSSYAEQKQETDSA